MIIDLEDIPPSRQEIRLRILLFHIGPRLILYIMNRKFQHRPPSFKIRTDLIRTPSLGGQLIGMFKRHLSVVVLVSVSRSAFHSGLPIHVHSHKRLDLGPEFHRPLKRRRDVDRTRRERRSWGFFLESRRELNILFECRIQISACQCVGYAYSLGIEMTDFPPLGRWPATKRFILIRWFLFCQNRAWRL